MPRHKVYPRFTAPNGKVWLQLVEFSLDRIGYVTINDGLPVVVPCTGKRLYERLRGMVEATKDFYEMETRRKLVIYTTEQGWVLCIEDSRQNVLDYKWLEKKAIKITNGIVRIFSKELSNATV